MEKIQIAKKIAETYLSNIINQSCEDEIKSEWPLIFEAFNYLGHRNNKLKTEYGNIIKTIWQSWSKQKEKNGFLRYKIFWPAVEYYLEPTGPYDAERIPGFEIENHLAMFRAQEIFVIPGFEIYFEDAKKRLEALLLEEYILNNYEKNRIIWQIVRSASLQLSLKDGLRIIGKRIIEYIEKCSYDHELSFHAKIIFFLILSNLGNEYIKRAKEILIKNIQQQNRDGSFQDDILTTSLFLSAIFLTRIDPNKVIIDKGIEWLLNKQNSDGSWEHWRIWGKEEEANILATVHILETLDLITNDRPLPIWAEKSRITSISQKEKPSRVQPIRPFPTPPGISWEDISIRFTSSEVVQLRAGDALEARNFIEMGFENQRSQIPDLNWEALIEFGKNQGEISIDIKQREIHPRIQKNIKYHVMILRRRLKNIFNIGSDPFFHYDRKTKTYKLRCAISVTEDLY